MQFSMPFGAAVALAYGRAVEAYRQSQDASAVALAYGRASLAEYAEGVPERPEIRWILSRVKCVTDPEVDAHFPREFRAWAEVATSDGRRLRNDIRYPKGDPENCLTWDEMKDEFTVLTAPVIS